MQTLDVHIDTQAVKYIVCEHKRMCWAYRCFKFFPENIHFSICQESCYFLAYIKQSIILLFAFFAMH